MKTTPYEIDGHNTLFGSVQAARRTTRTIFLGSAPSTGEQMIRGIQTERILLGAVQPGQTIGVFEDVLKRLRDQLHYLYTEQDRYWLDTRPNLRREMESRKQSVNERDELIPLIRDRVNRVFGRSHRFGGIHVFTPSADVPDEYGTGPRLVVLPMASAYSRTEANQAFAEAERILRHLGEQPRQRQNRLVFLAPDFDAVSRLKEQGRIFLAWGSIIKDIEEGNLNQDLSHLNQAKRHYEGAQQSLTQLIRETWKWLIAPVEEFRKDKPELDWEVVSISPTAPNLVQEIESKLREEEWLIYEWSPIHLRNVLNQWYLKDGVTEVSALKVWQNTCHYMYLPRLLNDTVFRDAIEKGVESEDYFGFASGKEAERYLGFSFGEGSIGSLTESALLIDREAAAAYAEHMRQSSESHPQPGGGPGGAVPPDDGGDVPDTPPGPIPGGGGTATGGTPKKHFYGTVSLDPVKAKMDFAKIMDEVVEHFTAKLGVDTKIKVEIEATNRNGFDETVQRTVNENCNTLKFDHSEFEEEE